MSLDPGIWVAAFITIATASLVWKENPFYRAAEHLYVGISAGHAVITAYTNIRDKAVKPIGAGEYLWIIPIILGLLLYSRYFKRTAWLSRYPVSVLP